MHAWFARVGALYGCVWIVRFSYVFFLVFFFVFLLVLPFPVWLCPETRVTESENPIFFLFLVLLRLVLVVGASDAPKIVAFRQQ